MPKNSNTIGIWVGDDDDLLDRVDDQIEWRNDSRSAWWRQAAEERLIVDNFFAKVGIEFETSMERRNAIKKALRNEFMPDTEWYTITCRKCDSTWEFDDKDKADTFYNNHEEHTGHEPTHYDSS